MKNINSVIQAIGQPLANFYNRWAVYLDMLDEFADILLDMTILFFGLSLVGLFAYWIYTVDPRVPGNLVLLNLFAIPLAALRYFNRKS